MRLSVEDVKKHPFFEGVDWQAVLEKRISVPFRPKIEEGELDTSNIDRVSLCRSHTLELHSTLT